jgi:hypothetical protein
MHLIVSGNKVSNRIHTNWNFENKKGRIRVSRFTPKSKIIFGNHKNSGAYRVKINSRKQTLAFFKKGRLT